MTLTEVVVAAAVLAIFIGPFAHFVRTMIKGLLTVEFHMKNEDMTIRALVDIERDFKDMNQVLSCTPEALSFYMDSHRCPNYDGKADPDGDGIPNRTDTDDDGDGFDFNRTARDYLALNASRPDVVGTGWRQGSDLQDDDDDNDGNRDVRCNYWYDAAQKTLFRDFVYGYGGVVTTTDPQIVFPNVVDLDFSASGTPFYVDPNTGSLPVAVSDLNGNKVFDVSELGGFPLDTLGKTRYISTISYTIKTKPNPKRPDTYTMASSIKPPLLVLKEKY